MALAMNQNPRLILSRVFPATACIVFFESAIYVIGVSDIKLIVFQALEDINVIHGHQS